jgi:hypothetical protein
VESEEQDEGTDKMSVSMLASSSAAFWQRMLRLRWERLQAEEAEALLEQEIAPVDGPEDDVSGAAVRLVCSVLRAYGHRTCVPVRASTVYMT